MGSGEGCLTKLDNYAVSCAVGQLLSFEASWRQQNDSCVQ